jgi:DNA (cytosine-5)-methyltransferase 1
LTFGSLFSGIGGIDLGLERAGMQCRWQSEIDPYASRVLAKHWPDIPNLGDVTKIDWRNVERTDVVAGGYPCQPFSVAGRRDGDNDPRHLWPHFRNAICVLRPRYALLENVSGHLSLGFGHVLADLAALGYDCRWDCIPAASVGAPHLRDRVFVIARDTRTEQRRPMADSNNTGSRDALRTRWHAPWDGSSPMGDTHGKRLERQRTEQQTARSVGASPHVADTDSERCEKQQSATVANQSGFCGGSSDEAMADTTGQQLGIDRSSGNVANKSGRGCDHCRGETPHDTRQQWAPEPNVGRVANGIPRRMDRLRALGNAVVPQVAEHIGNIIMEADNDCQIEAP